VYCDMTRALIWGLKTKAWVPSNYNRYNHGRGINFRRNLLLNVGLIGALKC